MKDVEILERNVDMIFGGINPSQYDEYYIYQNGENVERYDIEYDRCLWKILVKTFGNNLTVIKSDHEKVLVKIKSVPSSMREWVLLMAANVKWLLRNILGMKYREQ